MTRVDATTPLLEVSGLSRRFGGVMALKDLNFHLGSAEKLAVIGPNGAGKSTLLKLIAGQDRPTTGRIRLDGVGDVQGHSAHQLTRVGVALARQVPRPLKSLTVRENIQVGVNAGRSRSELGAAERIDEILETTGLAATASRLAGTLPLLDLKRLEVARALASHPRLLLLDEVSAGLNERDLDLAIELIARIHRGGTAILLVEHVQRVIHELADRVIVLNWGSLLAEGTPAEITRDPEVRRVYLGSGRAPSERPPRSAAVPARTSDTHGLEIQGVTVRRGALVALEGVDFRIAPGEVVALLGANGAGKTTLTQTISGLIRAQRGTISWEGSPITTASAHERARRGIAHCQEGRKLFPGMTVRENLELGAFSATRSETRARAKELMALFPVLEERASQIAVTMSGGQQQMLAIARALMSRPRLLLCDEVTLGLSPKVADEIYVALESIAAEGTSLLLVEQDADRCLGASSRAYLLQRGQVVYEGASQHLTDEVLVSAYLSGTTAE
jgi:branched-chain amino acid transport system ATP-binding protein